MKRVLLLNPPASKLYIRDAYSNLTSKANYYWPPIDLVIQSGILGEHFTVDVLDATALHLSPSESLSRIKLSNPDAIFFVTGSVSWPEDSAFIMRVKNEIHPIMIGSGNNLQFTPEAIMKKCTYLDAILFDLTSDGIVRYLRGEHGKIDNLIYRRNNRIIHGERVLSKDVISIPIPKHELFPLREYSLPFFRRRGPFAVCFSSYGCPYSCVYCYAGTVGFRLRNIDNLVSELKYLISLGIHKIRFRDPSFTNDGKHAMNLCKKIKDENLDIEWYCESRPDTLDEPLIKTMKECGCSMITFGVESTSEELLRIYRDTMPSKENILRSFALCKKYQIRSGAHIMLGLPGDDRQKILDTLKFLIKIDCNFVGFNIAMPRLGTKLRNTCIKNSWVSPDIQETDSSESYPIIESDKLPKDVLYRLHSHIIRKFYFRPHYIYKMLKDMKSYEDFKLYSSNALSIIFQQLKSILPTTNLF